MEEKIAGKVRSKCPSCSFIHYLNPTPAIVTIVLNETEDKFLLAKRSSKSFAPNLWCIPGGFMEFDESYLQACKREIKEETNLDIKLKGIINVTSNFFNENLHTIVITMLGISETMDCTPNDDVVELKWFSFKDDLPEMAFEADEFIINRYKSKPNLILPVENDR